MRNVSVLLAALCLSGCETIAALTFSPLQESGTGDQKIFVAFAPSEPRDPINAFMEKDAQLTAARAPYCPPPAAGAPISPSAVPIVAALGKLLFDSVAASLQRRVDTLKKSAQASYSGTMISDKAEDIGSRRCLVVLRRR